MSKEPLIAKTVRLPAEVIAQLEASAELHSDTVSDALRRAIGLAGTVEVGRKNPKRLQKPVTAARPTDLQLLLVLRGIAHNLDRIAQLAVIDHQGGSVPEYSSLLITLFAIERHLGAIRDHHSDLDTRMNVT